MAHVKIINSFSRLSEHGNVFWETLYKKLISRRPDTLKYFSNTDMHYLYSMLSKSVTYVVLNSSSNSVQSDMEIAGSYHELEMTEAQESFLNTLIEKSTEQLSSAEVQLVQIMTNIENIKDNMETVQIAVSKMTLKVFLH